MYKALFFPLLSIPSGHHQTADALIERLQKRESNIQCKKIDLLTYRFGKIEKLISNFYLKWIHISPRTYSYLYKKLAYNQPIEKNYYFYQLMFERVALSMIESENPSIIICTHALPSRIFSHLKEKKKINVPIINVYTDFFINRLWGIKQIDAHFVSTDSMASYLLEHGVDQQKIFHTGIPVHPSIQKRNSTVPIKSPLKILITGGSMGVGTIEKLLKKLPKSEEVQYYVLCGKNLRLFHYLKRNEHKQVIPLPYIDSREKMNMIYEDVDAVITKPGGVTVSECILKKIPIFIYHALPGQEEINWQVLSTLKIVKPLPYFQDEHEMMNYFYQNIKDYHQNRIFDQYENHPCFQKAEDVVLQILFHEII